MNSFAWGMLLWCMPSLMPLQPLPEDVHRFPPAAICRARAEELRQFACWLDYEYQHNPDWIWREEYTYWAVENQKEWANQARCAWENLAGAQDYVENRRYYLQAIIRYMGKECYQAGVCPPEAPLWWRLRR